MGAGDCQIAVTTTDYIARMMRSSNPEAGSAAALAQSRDLGFFSREDETASIRPSTAF